MLPPRKNDFDSIPPPGNFRSAPTEYPPLRILYSDDDYVAVDKPADLRISGDFRFNLQDMVAQRFPASQRPHPCHRLDYATSGAMLWALNPAAARRAVACFAARAAVKFYIAVVEGHFPG